jgi:hypothetical protein
MVKELKKMLEKYTVMSKKSEYVSISQVLNDLYYLTQEARLKRLPKRMR